MTISILFAAALAQASAPDAAQQMRIPESKARVPNELLLPALPRQKDFRLDDDNDNNRKFRLDPDKDSKRDRLSHCVYGEDDIALTAGRYKLQRHEMETAMRPRERRGGTAYGLNLTFGAPKACN